MKQTILDAMGKAFFASAWADLAESNGVTLSGLEIMDIMPKEIDKAAIHAAKTLCMDMENRNHANIETLYNKVADKISVENFGHYAAMESMGHGVGLFDYGIHDDVVTVPYVEFGSHSLEKDYF